MKPIVTSLGMIVFVAAIVAGGTGAFFSDTETSTGNVFTAGAIDLTVDSEQHYNNAICVVNPDEVIGNYFWQLEVGEVLDNPQYPVIGSPCDGTWDATDLGAHKFFNFLDVKPGDSGENTISLHVDNNDAYACIDVSITKNDDVTCTEPENGAEGTTTPCQTDSPLAGLHIGDPLYDGELAQNLEFFAWLDDGAIDGFSTTSSTSDPTEGDNIWQAGELPLFTNIIGPASDALDGKSYTLADPILGALVGSTTYYIGLEWCAGNLTTSGPGLLNCDGAQMGNDAQTDSMVADIAFRVEQARNNPNFSCTPREQGPTTGTLTVTKFVTNDNGGTAVVGSFPLFLDGSSISSGVATTTSSGSHTVSETGLFGYSATFGGDCAANGVVNVPAGGAATCTITNNDIQPVITLVKSVVGGTAVADDFDLSIDSSVVTSGSSNGVSANAAHELDEEVLITGYTETSVTGTSLLGVPCPVSFPGNMTLTPGDTATCTVTNTFGG